MSGHGWRWGGAFVAGAVLASGLMAPPQQTDAAWTDPEYGSMASIQAATVPAPVASCGLLSVGAVRVHWTPVNGATGYTVYYGSGGSTSASVGPGTTSYDLTGVVTGGTFRVQAVRNFGSTTWTSAQSNGLRYTVLLGLLGTCGLL